MVGTSAILRPASRWDLVHSRSCAGEVSSFKAVLPRGILSISHLSSVGADGVAHRLPKLGVVLEKFGRELLVQAQHVMQRPDLPVAWRACAYSHGRARQRL